jgi:hypothetical protein
MKPSLSLERIRYSSTWETAWEACVDRSRNGTIFHRRRFLRYHPADRFTDASLLWRYKGEIIAVLPAAIIESEGQRIYKSHPGSSFGGPVLQPGVDLTKVYAIVESMEAFAAQQHCDAIEMRISPSVFHRLPSDDLTFALENNGYQREALELSSVIAVDPDPQVNKQRMRYNTWQAARKADQQEELSVRLTDDWSAFWEILTQNLAYHDASPTHSLEEIQRLAKLFPGDVVLMGCYKESEMIAGTVIMKDTAPAVHTFYIAQNYDFQRLRPLNLLLAELINWTREKGYSYINLGISTEEHGQVINWGLFRFKEGFGATGSSRAYYRKQL